MFEPVGFGATGSRSWAEGTSLTHDDRAGDGVGGFAVYGLRFGCPTLGTKRHQLLQLLPLLAEPF